MVKKKTKSNSELFAIDIDLEWNGGKVQLETLQDANEYISKIHEAYQTSMKFRIDRHAVNSEQTESLFAVDKEIARVFDDFLAPSTADGSTQMLFDALAQKKLLHPDLLLDSELLGFYGLYGIRNSHSTNVSVERDLLLATAYNLNRQNFDKFAKAPLFLLGLIDALDTYRQFLRTADRIWAEKYSEINKSHINNILNDLGVRSNRLKQQFLNLSGLSETLGSSLEQLEDRTGELDKTLTKEIDDAIAASKSEALTHSAADLWKSRMKFSYFQSTFGFVALIALFVCAIGSLILFWPEITKELDKFNEGQIYRPTVLVTGIAGLTAFFTLARIFYRVTVSGLETAADAVERRALVQTFISLEGEGKLSADQDRELILRSLFRPGPRMGADHEPSLSLVDALISKLTAK